MDQDVDPLALLTINVETLAKHAGVFEGDTLDLMEETRARVLKRQLAVLQRRPRIEQDKIYHEFAAKYMPALVQRLRTHRDPYNSSLTMLSVISHTSYFVRFLRTPGGEGLASLQANRMAQKSTDYDTDVIGEMCQFLSMLLVLQDAGNVEGADRKALIPKLKQWQASYPGQMASIASDRCIAALIDKPDTNGMLRFMKEQLEASVTRCGVDGCTGSPRLMQCGQCRTALYCGPDHQRSNWPSHKPLCYSPSF